MATDPLNELSMLFARIKGMVLTEETATHAVNLLAHAAKETIPDALGAGITLIDAAGHKTSTGATDAVVKKIDALQYETGEGPCLSAWATNQTIRIDDLPTDDRWPLWSAAASAFAVRSTLSTSLVHDGTLIGAMKVYSPVPRGFNQETESLLKKFAGPAAVLLANVQTSDMPARLSSALKASLHIRDSISSAKGLLMERHHLEPEDAMAKMMAMSREQQVTLHRTAENILSLHSTSRKQK